MRRFAPLALVLIAAGCGGGGSTTERAATATQPSVVKPLVGTFHGVLKGTVRLQAHGSKQTAVTLDVGTGTGSRTVSVELDRGSCGAAKALQLAKPLGAMRSPDQSWSVTEALPTLTASPLAVVIRGANHGVVSCAQIGR